MKDTKYNIHATNINGLGAINVANEIINSLKPLNNIQKIYYSKGIKRATNNNNYCFYKRILSNPISRLIEILFSRLFFENIPTIRDKLLTLQKVGLGYMSIGQQATTLSGGEAQRIKLAKELSKRSTGRTIYILDEPTTGLHVHDVKKLLEVLQAFVQKGNTVVVIEHNMEVIKTADWIIDMGPDGGDKGGNIVFEGTPEQLLNIKESYTGKFLKKILSKKN